MSGEHRASVTSRRLTQGRRQKWTFTRHIHCKKTRSAATEKQALSGYLTFLTLAHWLTILPQCLSKWPMQTKRHWKKTQTIKRPSHRFQLLSFPFKLCLLQKTDLSFYKEMILTQCVPSICSMPMMAGNTPVCACADHKSMGKEQASRRVRSRSKAWPHCSRTYGSKPSHSLTHQWHPCSGVHYTLFNLPHFI